MGGAAAVPTDWCQPWNRTMLLILSLILLLWVLLGLALFWLMGRNPQPANQPLVRTVERRLCLVGDIIGVTLGCSATGLPRPQTETEPEPEPWDLVLVIDHSGSMGSGLGSALQGARDAAINLVRTTPGSFRFSVVEFDHEAREVCPLTDRRQGLIRALKGIARGGATDIALGLDVAGKSLEQHAGDPDGQPRQRAVLLLSDGGSEAEPAVANAEALKQDPDLLLITIGIGAADMPLLRRIASSPDHCFHADQIDQLTALYSEVGRMITGIEATEVKVSEHYLITSSWGLRGWGELQPSAFSLKDGEFCWLLAVLQEEPIKLHYNVEALCPGWWQIAPEPARLDAKTTDNQTHECLSNAGPRVLVLPRILGWQLLWLILNPLYYLLFGRFIRCGEAPPAAPLSVKPKPQPLELPPLLERARSPDPKLSMRPTLIVGLGYAGIQALVHAKRLLAEREERVDPEQLRFLAIDTADELFFPSPRAGMVGLKPDQRITLERPLEPIIATEATATAPAHAWLDAAALSAGGVRPDLHRGTGLLRPLGRLALLENRVELEARLGPLLDHLITRAGDRGLDLILTASSGGGTGSGGLLDLCWLLRYLLEQRGFGDSATNLFLSAPHAQQTLDILPEERAMREVNHRALLAELDRFSTRRGEPISPAPGLPSVRRWFDRVLIVGPAAREEWRAEEVLYPKTAEIIFTWVASDQSGSLRGHIVSQDAENARLTAAQGRCLLYRMEPASHYLYPATLRDYLIVDTLRRTLANRLWDVDEQSFVDYRVDAHKPERVALLLHAWLDARPQGTDYPWVFNALSALADATKLQQNLSHGAGPEISGGISPLARDELFEKQRELVRAVLDKWLLDTLNHGWQDICEPHALAICIHALRELSGRLREGTEIADHLVRHSNSPVVRREAETVAELSTQAITETETLLRRLGDWDLHLGEGQDGDGLLRLLDERTGLLRIEIDILRDADSTDGIRRGTPRSPRLPLDWAQIGRLPERFLAKLGDRLTDRLAWHVERDDIQLHINLQVRGSQDLTWTTDRLAAETEALGKLAEELIEVGTDLSPDFATWTLADQDLADMPELRPERPRTEQIQGARGLFLVQGIDQYAGAAHVDQVRLDPVDALEVRVISCEEHLPSNRLWPAPITASLMGEVLVPTYVFNEERIAYRGYHAYCHAENREPVALAATLVTLCRDPQALLGFALEGLAAGRLQARDDGMRTIWSVRGLAGQTIPEIVLGEQQQAPLATFQRIAERWLAEAASQPALRRFNAGPEESPDDLARRIGNHDLAAPIDQDPWLEQFVAVVWGLLRWH
ncbi:MAG TPA: hypothetical protein DIW77_02815 [Chromatiaceae bacterium]|nr:hypothetical protein [Chromatiaceae bacterium]